MTVLAVGLALLAAALLAVGSVAQRSAAGAVPDEQARGLRLVRRLVRSPVWWAGTLGDTGGFAVQAAALGVGSLLLVQPLLVTTLLFALPLEAWRTGSRVRRADAAWALLLAASLAVFVVVGEPTAGADRAPFGRWVPALLVVGALVGVCVALASRHRAQVRAAALGVATGLAYGLTAALTKSVVDLLGDGLPAVVTGWETWALVGAGVLGTLLQQAAFQAGSLAASLPAVTVGEPVVGVALGLAVLDEQVRADGAEWALIGVLVVAMVAAAAALAARTAGDAGLRGR